MREFVTRADTAVVIPAHDGLGFTTNLLDSLRGLEGPDLMVVLVDDGSTDGTAEHVAEHYPDVLVLPAGGLWWTGAVDLGCRFAIQRGARRLLLLPNDEIVSANLVVELNRLLDEGAGCVGAVCVDRPSDDGEHLESCGALDWAGRGISLRRLTDAEEARGVASCDWMSGMSLMFDASLYRELGGFDVKRFPHYRGDIDFTLRVREHGRECLVTTRAWIYNDPGQTWMSFQKTIPLRAFLRGFWNYKSDYNVRETVRFALAYCPPRLLPHYLFQFYARWIYAFLKTHWPALGRLARSSRRAT